MKRVFAILCAVLVMACAVVPCFASNWSEETPEYASAFYGTPTEYPFASIRGQVQTVVEKAYELGLFGGARPTFVNYYFNPSGSWHIIAFVPNPSSYSGFGQSGYPKESAYQVGFLTPASNGLVKVMTSSSANTPFSAYVLCANGDWGVVQRYSSGTSVQMNTGAVSNGGFKMACYWGTSANPNEWKPCPITSYAVGNDTSSTPINNQLQAIISAYDRALEGNVEEIPEPETPELSFQLDIASIFDGYFNGLRDVLGAFDLDLFGINVVGVLIACLVIAIVAFIVRKLWK